MSLAEQIITIGLCAVATMFTRFLPFIVFNGRRTTPKYIDYLGRSLPLALFGMLCVYCLKDTNIISETHGIPELIAVVIVALLHLWKRKMMLSIAAGTVCYMLLVQLVF